MNLAELRSSKETGWNRMVKGSAHFLYHLHRVLSLDVEDQVRFVQAHVHLICDRRFGRARSDRSRSRRSLGFVFEIWSISLRSHLRLFIEEESDPLEE